MHTITEIQKVKQTEDGTYLIIRVPKLQLQDMLMEKRIRQAEIRFDDGRTISIEQRKKAYATIRDISAYTGCIRSRSDFVCRGIHPDRQSGPYRIQVSDRWQEAEPF